MTGTPRQSVIVKTPLRISLGGGGRYDKLAANLGGANSNALGFAYNIDAISEAIK